jgi:hypothetical protein
MIRLLIAILLGAVISSQAPAQNRASQTLLALNEDERNTAVTRLLRESNEKCDQVIRTLFIGTELGLDECEALCRDRNSYLFILPPELSAGIELLSCRELLATSKILLHRAGSKRRR